MAANWKSRLNEQRDLQKKGAELLYQRVRLLVAIYDDQEFRDWCADSETDEVEYLDNELSDVACEFMTLKAVLKEHPDESAWVSRNLRELIAEVLEGKRRKRAEESPRVSWKEKAIAAEKECERLRAELNAQSARIAELHNVIGLMRGDHKKAKAVA